MTVLRIDIALPDDITPDENFEVVVQATALNAREHLASALSREDVHATAIRTLVLPGDGTIHVPIVVEEPSEEDATSTPDGEA